MLTQILLHNHGYGSDVVYDMRYPGTFSATFKVKGQKVRINNLKKKQLHLIIEKDNIRATADAPLYGIVAGRIYGVTKITAPSNNCCAYTVYLEDGDYENLYEWDFKKYFPTDKFTNFKY